MAHSITRFNVLTFSTGATFAVLFLVLLVGFYPRVTAALFTHFFYFLVIAVISIVLALWAMYTYYLTLRTSQVQHRAAVSFATP